MLRQVGDAICRFVHRPRILLLLAPVVVLSGGLLGASCTGETTGSSASTSAGDAPSSPPSSVGSTSSAPAPSTTMTTTFPEVVVQAMAQFSPLPPGARAPIRLPVTTGYVTAETGGLGGQDNVTLIATRDPVAVDSPTLSSAGAGTELASFSTTPTTSSQGAAAQIGAARTEVLAACQSPPTDVTLDGVVAATTCSTIEGSTLDWTVGDWSVQVLSLDGTSPPTTEADHVVLLGATGSGGPGLPGSDAGGIVSVVVPGSASAGSTDTAAIEWSVGADVYQVRSSDDPDAAFAVAAAMAPYPG